MANSEPTTGSYKADDEVQSPTKRARLSAAYDASPSGARENATPTNSNIIAPAVEPIDATPPKTITRDKDLQEIFEYFSKTRTPPRLPTQQKSATDRPAEIQEVFRYFNPESGKDRDGASQNVSARLSSMLASNISDGIYQAAVAAVEASKDPPKGMERPEELQQVFRYFSDPGRATFTPGMTSGLSGLSSKPQGPSILSPGKSDHSKAAKPGASTSKRAEKSVPETGDSGQVFPSPSKSAGVANNNEANNNTDMTPDQVSELNMLKIYWAQQGGSSMPQEGCV